jgi:hypothetical protein
MVRKSVPASNQWVAQLWRSVCGVTRLLMPARPDAQPHCMRSRRSYRRSALRFVSDECAWETGRASVCAIANTPAGFLGIGQELPKLMSLERLNKEEPQSGYTVHRSAWCHLALLQRVSLIASQLIRFPADLAACQNGERTQSRTASTCEL